MDKNQTKGHSNDEKRKGKEVAEHVSQDSAKQEKGSNKKGYPEQQKGKDGTVIGDINGDARKGKK